MNELSNNFNPYNIFVKLMNTIKNNTEFDKIAKREMVINENDGSLIYKDVLGVTRTLDVSALSADIRNYNERHFKMTTNGSEIGNGYDMLTSSNKNIVNNLTKTMLHELIVSANNVNTKEFVDYALLLRDTDNNLEDVFPIPPLYRYDSEKYDTLNITEGVLYRKTSNFKCRVLNVQVLDSVGIIKLTPENKIEPSGDFITVPATTKVDISVSDNISHAGKTFYNPTDKSVYLIYDKNVDYKTITIPETVIFGNTNTTEYRIPFAGIIPIVKGNKLELVGFKELFITSDINGEIEFTQNLDIITILKARIVNNLESPVAITDFAYNPTTKVMSGLRSATVYSVSLKLNKTINMGDIIYKYNEFIYDTFPTIQNAVAGIGRSFEHYSNLLANELYSIKARVPEVPGYVTSHDIITLTTGLSKFKLNIPEYDASADMLDVSINGGDLTPGVDYIINEENNDFYIQRMIDGVITNTPWADNSVFRFKLIRRIGVPSNFTILSKHENTFDIVEDTTTFIPINIPEFNPDDDDIIMVLCDNIPIVEGVNYVTRHGVITHNGVQYTGHYVELIGYHVDYGSVFFFTVLKNNRSEDIAGEIDPVLIRKGLTLNQFAGNLGNDIVLVDRPTTKQIYVKSETDVASYPLVATHKSNTTKNGLLLMRLPFGWCNTDVNFKIRVKANSVDSNMYSITVNGRLSNDNDTWENMSVMFDGSYNTAKLSFASISNSGCIILGDDTTEWNKELVVIENFVATGEFVDNWNTNWEFGIYTTAELDAMSITDLSVVRPIVSWNSHVQDVVIDNV